MKKFISMIMAAAMAASLIPSTAFAAVEKNKITTVGEIEWSTEEAKSKPEINGVELQITLKDEFNHSFNNMNEVFEFDLDFEGAEALVSSGCFPDAGIAVYRDGVKLSNVIDLTVEPYNKEDNHFEFKVIENNANLLEGDKIILTFNHFGMTKYSKGATATVSVSGDFGSADNLAVANIFSNTLNLKYANKLVEITDENIKELKTITIESKVGKFAANDEIKVKVNSGFEFVKTGAITGGTIKTDSVEENEFIIEAVGGNKEIKIAGMEIEAVNVKEGKVAAITVTSKGYESDTIDVAKVIADEVQISVDEDIDIPVIYSGTDANNTGLTTNEDHKALAVTIEGTSSDSWDAAKKWTLTLPEGVYVSNIESNDIAYENMTFKSDVLDTFKAAYKKGDFEQFEFEKRVFTVDKDKNAKLEFTFELIAEPDFEGQVELTFDNGEFKDTVIIAEFVKPYSITAQQNDVSIDYRYTKLNSNIVITEAEEDLWKDVEFIFDVDHMDFEDTTTYNSNFDIKAVKDKLGFKTKETSDNEPFKVTISNMSLYMDRSLPAGGYDLVLNTTMSDAFMQEDVFGGTDKVAETYYDTANYDEIVKEDFVNIITGDADTFITKVEVPIGENYLKAGDTVITLDVPAYINTDNYTMLPVRAVAVALGINNDAIVWDNNTKTVTIFYGNRIITMAVGANIMTVNGTTVPTATCVEVKDGRMFIPMRDLATAMNAELTWDAANRTAIFN